MHWYYDTPMGWGGFVMMALFMLVFFGGLIALGVAMLRRTDHHHSGSALHILEERLARGEIDTDEFDRVRKTLRTR
ncbi:SHOCT domain-containing protein [Lentzea sp. BCCO 10_0856]|uniref:SHOCT domain-containing protein n=1 Tax=Lentzea miocenica TaxID=3095431 RepID=A0ABU4T9U9_9PSEU|nr:SHOCT domain-containing protein [Lentzea sp. BCCO 10_0856]MDX8034950.1 SHOCT domain-containing protein [Lentzea sp. BCCO 10_0856]